MTKVGIIGSGGVAQALGKGFLENGYEVQLSSRDQSKLSDWLKEDGKGASTGSFAETAAFGDIVVLAVKGTAALAALELCTAANLEDKTVIDASNPIADAPPENGVLKFSTNINRSLMEDLQAAFPQARFVKAFNSVGSAFMVNPQFELKPSMFICGNDEDAKSEVKTILDNFGWDTEDMGKVEAARAIEPLCMLWCIPGFLNNQWSHAFKLMKLKS